MSLAVIHTRAVSGIHAIPVSVEIHLGGGLPSLSVVGLPETAVKESKDRVRAALLNAGFEFPARRITINLAPADLPKHGGRFDLAIAVGILVASGQMPSQGIEKFEFVGELALGGDLRRVNGVLPTAIHAAKDHHKLIVPNANAAEAALSQNSEIYGAHHLLDICRHFSGAEPLCLYDWALNDVHDNAFQPEQDLSDVRGQHLAKRALEIAASGNHHLLMTGPPGTGKSMLASRLPGILPPMSQHEALETAAIYSVSQKSIDVAAFRRRAFRAPHHTASGVALVGGGTHPKPGEISLAHNGVLFLDELPEFNRHVLDVLREPIETGKISISRAATQAEFPARFQLIAAMNPCPCGHYGDEGRECRCSPAMISRYQAKVSGPLLDRIDIAVTVPRLDLTAMRQQKEKGESSAKVRERVIQTRQRQLSRAGKLNAELNSFELELYCQLKKADLLLLEKVMEQRQLSMRAYSRILKTARTIADMVGEDDIKKAHLMEAIAYR